MQSVQETNSAEEKLLRLAAEIDEFEGYARAHASRIATLADAVAKKFNLSPHDRHSLRLAALVHDLGEVAMNRDYIKANRLLREDERIDMQRHTVIGEQEAARRGLSRAVQLLVRWHHEWWNGAGYPDALERDLIPLAARILRVCDTYAAMTDSRPYRIAVSEAEAKKCLIEWAGIEFDPLVVKAFLSLEGLKELASFEVSEKKQPAEISYFADEHESSIPESAENPAAVAVVSDDSADFAEQNAPNSQQQQQQQQTWNDNN